MIKHRYMAIAIVATISTITCHNSLFIIAADRDTHAYFDDVIYPPDIDPSTIAAKQWTVNS